MGVSREVDLRNLAARIRAIEERHDVVPRHGFIDQPASAHFPTGWPDIDTVLGGGLAVGGLHEWLGVEEAGGSGSTGGARSLDARWTPPLCILAHLAWQALDHQPSLPWTLWIGERCHPYPRVLIRDGGRDRRLLKRSLFVASRDAAARLWAIDSALRSPAVGVIIADGSGFHRAATQRVQSLARTQSKWVLATCPSRQQSELSAAQTRWLIHWMPSVPGKQTAGGHPRWIVELLRCKGMRPTGAAHEWLLEWNRAKSTVGLSARLADLAGPPETEAHVAFTRRPQRAG